MTKRWARHVPQLAKLLWACCRFRTFAWRIIAHGSILAVRLPAEYMPLQGLWLCSACRSGFGSSLQEPLCLEMKCCVEFGYPDGVGGYNTQASLVGNGNVNSGGAVWVQSAAGQAGSMPMGSASGTSEQSG